MGQIEKKGVILVISALLRAVVLKEPAKFDSLISLNLSSSDADGVDALFAELIDIVLEICARVLAQESLQDAQVALVVDFGSRLEGLEWLDHLDGQPVAHVSDLSDDHLVEPLQTSLVENRQHSVVSDLELVAVSLSKL